MDQMACVDNIAPAEIKLERRKVPEASVTEREKFTSRGVWRAMQWPPCTQTDVMKSNRTLKEMKSDLVELRVHAHRNEKLAVVVWSGGAWANQKDLSSTLCFFSGITTTRILKGERHGVTPIHHRSGKSKRNDGSSCESW